MIPGYESIVTSVILSANIVQQCVYRGEDVHVCMLLNSQSYEASSGGPFFRDINSNNAGDSTNLYFYMNSGHVQTEKFRQGLHGPYAMAFSRSGIPAGGSSLDTSFFKDLSISGYVADSARGKVTGTATGIGSSFQKVLHWYNDAAQYWVYADSAGKFTSPAMKPGAYTQVLYQSEFKVKAASITVKAGSTTTANIAADTETKTSVWRIGDWAALPRASETPPTNSACTPPTRAWHRGLHRHTPSAPLAWTMYPWRWSRAQINSPSNSTAPPAQLFASAPRFRLPAAAPAWSSTPGRQQRRRHRQRSIRVASRAGRTVALARCTTLASHPGR